MFSWAFLGARHPGNREILRLAAPRRPCLPCTDLGGGHRACRGTACASTAIAATLESIPGAFARRLESIPGDETGTAFGLGRRSGRSGSVVPGELRIVAGALFEERVASFASFVGAVSEARGFSGEQLLPDEPVVRQVEAELQ